MKNLNINSPKAIIAVLGLVAVTLLMVLHTISSDSGMPIITMLVGYSIGNGIARASGVPVEPIIGGKKTDGTTS